MNKKQSQEELIKTHVLNLAEIREAEQKEIHLKVKKMPILFSLIGIFLLILGFSYSRFIQYFVKNDKLAVASTLKKSNLTCVANFKDKTNNLKIQTKTIYSFNNRKLISANNSTSFSIIKGDDYTFLLSLKEQYSLLYQNVNNDVIYTTYINDNTLYFNSIINNYHGIDSKSYNSLINTVNHTPIFEGGENFEVVRQNEENLGNKCH